MSIIAFSEKTVIRPVAMVWTEVGKGMPQEGAVMELRELPAVLGALVFVVLDYWISGRLNIDTVVWKAVAGALAGQFIHFAIQKTAALVGGHFFPRKRAR